MRAKKVLALILGGALATGIALIGFGIYLSRPLPAEDIAALALKGALERPYGYLLRPRTPKALLAFYPGARVDPRAYAPLLAPLAEEGYAVALLKVPVGIALLAKERGLEAGRELPGLPLVLGGHSLGGVVAAEVAAREGLPLFLFASYPETDLSGLSIPTLALYNKRGWCGRGYNAPHFSAGIHGPLPPTPQGLYHAQGNGPEDDPDPEH